MYNDILQKIEDEGKLSRDQMIFLYVINAFDELRKMGIISGGRYEMSEKGREILGDFNPTPDELDGCLETMKREGLF